MNTIAYYPPPEHLPDIDSCNFYHVMELPRVGVVGNGWDLRKTVDVYLGNFDFRGKRVLDVGTAGGFLTFEMEKRGAEVVSFEMNSGRQWNIVPFTHANFDYEKVRKGSIAGNERLRNAYWFAHRELHSKAKLFLGDIYDLPAALGTFDVVVLGMVLPHLQDPFQALFSASRLSTKSIIVTQQTIRSKDPVMHFMPDPKTCSPDRAWWVMSDALVKRWYHVLGFELEDEVTEKHYCKSRNRSELCTAFVGRKRTSR